MKYNFVFSNLKELWISSAVNLFIVDPFVFYFLKKTGNDANYNDIKVVPYRRTKKNDLQNDHDFVQLKFEKYVILLAEKLNQIHGTNHSTIFWRRALSLSFERHITFLYEVYENCRIHFDSENHNCIVLSRSSYQIPKDFEEHRNFFQHSDFGQEQLFSIYMHLFYPKGLKSKDVTFLGKFPDSKESVYKRLIRLGFSSSTFDKIWLKLLMCYYTNRPHRVGVFGSFFSTKNLCRLLIESKGRVFPLDWKGSFQINSVESANIRTNLSEFEWKDLDDFDKYFINSLQYCLPKVFIENFSEIKNYFYDFFRKYPDLNYVTSEVWLSQSFVSIGLAILHERNVKHIYNEHNYFEHPWIGSMIPLEASLVDTLLSLGWSTDSIQNLVKGSSLSGNFEVKVKKTAKKLYDICYIGSGAASKRPSYSASYGWCCENAPKYFSFVSQFFEHLSIKTKNQILYRAYPNSKYEDLLLYDQDYMLGHYLNQLQKQRNTNISANVIMQQSRLVIVDYISTSYLESLLLNIPTIFFWNPDAYYLSDHFKNFFDLLISEGICQTNPLKAAAFVEIIKSNPEEWWFSESVQNARNRFIELNFGKPAQMFDYLVQISAE
jgi:putative transferase (TIGR04331 family)